jgi:uncharacterized lipoprotein YmbA
MLIALSLVLLLGACARASRPADFYVLSAEAQSPADGNKTELVVFGPLRLPAYLERPQIVTRKSSGGLDVDEFHRWAAPLPQHMSQVMADNIAILTGNARVIPFLSFRRTDPGLQVLAFISRFEGDDTGAVVLEVTWRVEATDGDAVSPIQRSRYTASAAPGDYAALVAAMNRLLLAWSQDIVIALSGVSGQLN